MFEAKGGKGGKSKYDVGKGIANSNRTFYLAVPANECKSILIEGFTCRRRSYVPVSASPSEAFSGFSRSARRAGAISARAAVVLEVRDVPSSVRCLKTDEGFQLLTTHLPAYLLKEAKCNCSAEDVIPKNYETESSKQKLQSELSEKGSLERKLEEMESELSEKRSLERKLEEAETAKQKLQSELSEKRALERKLEETETAKQTLQSEYSYFKSRTIELEQVVDQFACVARPRYWQSQTHNGKPSFELIDVTSHDLTCWLSTWMWWSSHEECKIGKVSPWITKVRRVESDAAWLRFQTQIVAMRTYHAQHGINLKPIEPYVWYPPTNHAPQALIDTLQSSMNEHLLFHGTSPETAEEIAKRGFDIVRSRDGSLYGAGFYFAQEFCKSAQYGRGTRGNSTRGTVLICRVALGDVEYHASAQTRPKQRPKRSDSTVYDALVVEPRPAPKPPELQVHREFVVHESAQIYVEYIVDYELADSS